jgi:hypothetical protein
MAKLYVGDLVTVAWSNGHGESVYRVVENAVGPATFELVSERDYSDEFNDDWVMPEGYTFCPIAERNADERYGDDGMDDDDVKAVMRDIQTRRRAQGVIV